MDRHGNLDNRPVPRVLVHLDVFSQFPEPEERPTGLRARLSRALRAPEPPVRAVDPLILSGLWRWADQRSVVLEAFDTETSEKDVQAFLDQLETHQQHPFRTGHAYRTPQALAAELPYRRDLVGVFDVPERGMAYGSWWIDPQGIF